MRRNSGLIGKSKYSNKASTSGMYDLFDQYANKKDETWPLTKVYNITLSHFTAFVGETISINIATEGVLDTTLYYSMVPVGILSSSSHWIDSTLNGSFELDANGNGFVSKMSQVLDHGEDLVYYFAIRTGSTTGPIVAQSANITIPRATFSVSPALSSFNEGDSGLFNISVTNVGQENLYLTTNALLTDVTATSTPIFLNWDTQSPTTTSLFTVREDALTEGSETYTTYLRRDSTNGLILASSTWEIADTSRFLNVVANTTNVNEGGTVNFTVTTTDYNGTLAYDIMPDIGGTAEDFTTTPSAAFNIINNTATFNVNIKDDLETEGPEAFYLRISNHNISGSPTVGTSSSVLINDTSKVTSTSLSASNVNEGGSVTVTVFGQGTSTQTLFWSAELVSGNVLNDSDIVGGPSGNFTYSNSSGSGAFSVTFANDGFTEGPEDIRFIIRSGSDDGTIIATTAAVTVGDTSTGTAEPSGIGSDLVAIETTLSSYTESTPESTVINAIEALGYTVIATPRYGSLAEQMSGVTGTMTTSGNFRIDSFDSTTNYIELSGGFSTSALNGYPYLCYAGFDNGAFQGTAVMLYRDYTSSTTLLKNLFYPNQDRNLFTHLRYADGSGVLENSSTSPVTSTIYSDNQQPGVNGYNSTSRFAVDDGAWGYVNGIQRLDGNGGPYHTSNNLQAVGCANQNGGDTSGANFFYFGSKYRSSTTYRFYIFTKFV